MTLQLIFAIGMILLGSYLDRKFSHNQRTHYFRCVKGTTSTESSYAVPCGKGCTKVETEIIKME